jgi:uncharacterized protein YndB with AHSA1/START domain
MPAATIEPIHLTIETTARPSVVWAYLTEPDRVAEWFTEASPVGVVGELYRLDFGEGSVVEGSIVELEPGRTFAHRWAWTDTEPRQPTLVTWRVEPLGDGGSRLELIHDGWAEAGADEALRDDHEAYWSGYLDDLQDILEDAISS